MSAPLKPQVAAIKERVIRQTKLADSQCDALCTAHAWRAEADEAHWEVHELFAGALDDIKSRLPPPRKRIINGNVGKTIERIAQYRGALVAGYRIGLLALGILLALWQWARSGKLERLDALIRDAERAIATEGHNPQASNRVPSK